MKESIMGSLSYSVFKICLVFYTLQYAESIERRIVLNRALFAENIQCRQQRYPDKNDRIAIIGAGAAGIHMAYKLQMETNQLDISSVNIHEEIVDNCELPDKLKTGLGYTDVTVFEKTSIIGGKCLTLDHKGTRQEMGATYTTLEYEEIFKLLKEFDVGLELSSGTITRWISQYNYFQAEYPLFVIAKEYGIKDPKAATSFLLDAVQRYITLHKSMFSDYDGELFPRPNATVLKMTRGTFMQFLQRNNIEVLKTIFISTHTTPGYGNLDEISALYGLMWNTPKFISAAASPSAQATGILERGYQKIWEAIVKKERIKIILNADIKSIKRRTNVLIRYAVKQKKCAGRTKSNEFDFLILASNIKDLIATSLMPVSSMERRIFKKLRQEYLTTTLVDSMYGRRGPNPSDYYFFRQSDSAHTVWGTLESYGMLKMFSGQNYTNGLYPGNSNGEFIQSAIFYQYGKNNPSKAELDSKLQEHMVSFGFGKNYSVVQRKVWSYFPRFSPRDMSSGILWDILDIQGYQNTWYIGSSVCFESVKSVVEYNKLLLRKFNLV